MNFGSLIPWRDKRAAPMPRDQGDPFAMFRREIDRVFEDFFGDFASPAMRTGTGSWSAVTPVVDVTETVKEVALTAELPGLDEKDFEVTLTGDLLTIKGEKKDEREQKDGGSYYMERRFGSFSRSVRLPFEASDEDVNAIFDKGLADGSHFEAGQRSERRAQDSHANGLEAETEEEESTCSRSRWAAPWR